MEEGEFGEGRLGLRAKNSWRQVSTPMEKGMEWEDLREVDIVSGGS